MPKVEIVKRHKSVRTRTRTVFLRLNEDEQREVTEAAEAALLPVTTWARQVLVLAAKDAKAQIRRLRGNIVNSTLQSPESTESICQSQDDANDVTGPTSVDTTGAAPDAALRAVGT